jgi:lipopolysaccharide/colanic/teichoic acid biosynthesis glycosyltransferase
VQTVSSEPKGVGPTRPPIEADEPAATIDDTVRPLPRGRAQAANQPPPWVGPRDSALPLNDFLRDLRREKRRADRSHAPLSLVVYQVEGSGALAFAHLRELVDLLRRTTRETDSIGRVGDHVVAVLCPDTDESGARCLIEKVDASANGLPYGAVAATYPDELFEQLARGVHEPSNVYNLLISEHAAVTPGGYGLKRALDVVGAVTGLVLASPIMLLTAVAIASTSAGPIIFRQKRVGRDGIPFMFYKFRSMIVDNDERVHRDFVSRLIKDGSSDASDAAPTETQKPLYKIRRDPRITAVGRFIRKTSIDELPQLWNVLKGDMSLVGPRPPIPYETEHYQAWHARRMYSIKPGLTGLWQVEGRSSVTFNEMVRIDLRYVRSCSLLLDLKILAKTVGVVLTCKGAD